MLGVMALVPGYAALAMDDASSADGKKTVVEYVSQEVMIPLLKMEEGQVYTVDVFDKADAAFASPLECDGYTFTPEKLGEYTIRYRINDNGHEYFVYSELSLVDTSVPQFALNVEKSYNVGDTVDFTPAITDNTSHWATVTYTLLCGGKEVDASAGSVTFDTAGDYKLRVGITDAGGNYAAQTYSFTVVGGGQSQNGWVVWVCSFGGAAVAIAAGVAAFFIVKRRRKTDKENTDEQ